MKYTNKDSIAKAAMLWSTKRHMDRKHEPRLIPFSRDEVFIWAFLVPPGRDHGGCCRGVPGMKRETLNMNYITGGISGAAPSRLALFV